MKPIHISLWSRRRLAVAGVAALLALASFSVAAAATVTHVVRPANMQGWSFVQEQGSGSTMQLVTGPGTPPLGTGSARLRVTDTTQGAALRLGRTTTTRLDQITQLNYSTYRASGASTEAISLQLNVDFTQSGSPQGRLVFEPHRTATVSTGAWQTWNTTAGNAIWYQTWSSAQPCFQTSPCTWNTIRTIWPNARVMNVADAITLKAGPGFASFDGNVDRLEIGVLADIVRYDFEPASVTPTPTISGTKAEWLINKGVPGKGIQHAPGLQKPFNAPKP